MANYSQGAIKTSLERASYPTRIGSGTVYGFATEFVNRPFGMTTFPFSIFITYGFEMDIWEGWAGYLVFAHAGSRSQWLNILRLYLEQSIYTPRQRPAESFTFFCTNYQTNMWARLKPNALYCTIYLLRN